MTIAYLSLGSNLRTPERQMRQALHRIRTLSNLTLLQISPLYFNPAVGRRSQPPFCNCVIKIKTTLSPKALLRLCLSVEKLQQRTRKVRWGARTLDIDILLYGNRTIHQPDLMIPHPRMLDREFVLMPLLSLEPDIQITYTKTSVG